MDKSQISNNSNLNQRSEYMNSRQNPSIKLFIYLFLHLSFDKFLNFINDFLDKKQNEPAKDKKNYVIEFNKADLKPHLILEKDANARKKNISRMNNMNNNKHETNNLNDQDIVRESNNFYYNEGKTIKEIFLKIKI